MLWYKSWLDTRWRFLIGFAILALSACATVVSYSRVTALLPLVPNVDTGTELGRRIQESAELIRTYRGYVYSQWFAQNLIQMWTMFAVLLGSGSLLSSGSDGAALFTLSLPIARSSIVFTRAATGLAELFALALLPSLLVPLLSPAVGHRYSLVDVIAHSACVFVAGAVFFHAALLLSTMFHDVWRPLLITLAIAVMLAVAGQFVPQAQRVGIYQVMSGDLYFRAGRLPWLGLAVSAAVSGALLYTAKVNFEGRDF